jgi:hypothetical protein
MDELGVGEQSGERAAWNIHKGPSRRVLQRATQREGPRMSGGVQRATQCEGL